MNENSYIYVVCDKYSSMSYFNYVNILLVDSKKLYDNKKNRIIGYSNYQIGIILDKDNFIPTSTNLILYPSNNKMYSIPIYKRNSKYPANNKPYFRINKLNLLENDYSIEPILLKVKVNKIHHSKNVNTGFIDLVIGDNYYI